MKNDKNRDLKFTPPSSPTHPRRAVQSCDIRGEALHHVNAHIGEHVGARDLALEVRVFAQRVEEVGGGHQEHVLVALRRCDTHVHPNGGITNTFLHIKRENIASLWQALFVKALTMQCGRTSHRIVWVICVNSKSGEMLHFGGG